jgi:hypothetical protein
MGTQPGINEARSGRTADARAPVNYVNVDSLTLP